ncbi:Magnesium-like protein [Mycena venus]|uniref:Magnesium-like protein n=1 Tax=Mycena venus TaxID=2733690 RepID=A0A8H6Y4V0_9AGAR|nr:Magnesium-like protein [Mycena venus]
MPRENSFSDSDGRSLTPELEDNNTFPLASSPNCHIPPNSNTQHLHTTHTRDSVRSPISEIRPASLRPKDRFRYAVRKVIALQRGTNIMIMSRRSAGAEPGIDARRASADADYGGVKQECVIELADYSAVRSSFGRMTNSEFVDLLNDPGASAREPWVKVRWINIGGMSWDVIKAISMKYDLHPLALEDVFHAHPRARSKADYYTQHLFLRILCHELDELNQEILPSYPPTQFSSDTSGDEKTFHSARRSRPSSSKPSSDPYQPHHSLDVMQMRATTAAADDQRRIQDATLRALKGDDRVNVNVVPMFIFLFRDGTVITIHSTPNLEMTAPITSRVRQFNSILRTSADASILVQSLLDLVADQALEVVNAYQTKIKRLESQILVKPTIDTVRSLHILSADLILHRRTLAPIQTVVYGLRRYDADRSAALVDVSLANAKDPKVKGFMSHGSLVYLADVHDHMGHLLSQLDMIAGIGQNLVDYTFNVCPLPILPSPSPAMTSYEMSEVMRRLMLVTVIFLPPDILDGVLCYWAFALPIMAIILPLFLVPDIRRVIHYVRKKMLTRKVVKSFNA